MIVELIVGVYAILFCLGFYTDYSLSMKSNNKYYLFSLPLTAPIIGFLTLKNLVKLRKLKKVNKDLEKLVDEQ